MAIVEEVPDYIQVFSDGSVKRFGPPTVAPSLESNNGYRSKDVFIDKSKGVTARIFLPDNAMGSSDFLPVLVYFHGGGFCIGSTTWIGYHHFLGDLSVTSKCVVVSVDYRLAPENRLPIAYEDCFSSLAWLSDQVGKEPFLKQADLSRVFLSGDSAGGNITHNVALRATEFGVKNVRIGGLMLIHPYFGTEKRTELEMSDGANIQVQMNDLFWRLSLPEGSNRDHFSCNFETAEVSAAVWNKFPPVVVYVAGLDFLKERGVLYCEFLKKRGIKVMLVEAKEESHVYHVFHPESEATRLLQCQMREFMNHNCY
ncbi:hypothetical protein Scep_008407 [Stephania cephalantha]|uniref:Alpha/beta hydrolase fold-3 domain-containing protein n=1 Tax=Stephania cephalantha TaxID=152367 RepID=A0AAP0PPK9_9MAGN